MNIFPDYPVPSPTCPETEPQRPGPLRNGNPRGNPNAAPRCGAKTRQGCPCRGPAMANGRCRMHGGKSTGPRTAAGRARVAAAQTIHGEFTAEGRDFRLRCATILARGKKLRDVVTQALAEPARAPSSSGSKPPLGEPAETGAPARPDRASRRKNPVQPETQSATPRRRDLLEGPRSSRSESRGSDPAPTHPGGPARLGLRFPAEEPCAP